LATVEVTMDLPFLLRLEGCVNVTCDEVCKEFQVPELKGHNIEITFSRTPASSIDKSGWHHERTTVAITLETPEQLPDDSVNAFAIRNCLEILNRVITSYQATTGEVNNAGFIFPLGTSDMQLFADIRVNGRDFRDRWPSHSFSTFPLPNDKIAEFKHYLIEPDNMSLSRLFLTNAWLSLARGQYPLAILQGATAVELRVTQVICAKLRTAGWSEEAVEPYEKMTLGGKLKIPRMDPRSLETYFDGVSGFAGVYAQARDDLTPLRNRVAHQGWLASHEEARRAAKIANDFLAVVN
jgi:hypothetical protein